MMVLDEGFLMELALWGWVVFVLSATRPNYD
jgi:predicted DNA-binding transcriptional regulator